MDFDPVVKPPYVAKPLRLEPFRALLLAPARVGDPASARAFARPYRAVAERLRTWEANGRVTHDAVPALYLHEYTAGGLTVRGLVGALVIAHRATSPEQRAVWPHEGIHPAQVEELASRMGEMGMNPAPILLVHEGPEVVRTLLRAVADRKPHTAYLDRAGQKQRIWTITDPQELAVINNGLRDSTALIADGHHRYAAYLKLQQDHPGTSWDRGLAMLVDQDDTPLFLGAIHRTLAGVTLQELLAAVTAAGGSSTYSAREQAVSDLAPDTLVATDAKQWATMRPPSLPGATLVQWLQEQVVPRLPREPAAISFHHAAKDALAKADNNTVAVLLPAPDFAVVRDVVSQGGLLPEKATSFQPKPSLGVLMRSVLDEAAAPT